MFIDVKKVHFIVKCDEDEWVVQFGKCAKLKRWLCGVRNAASG